MHENIKQKNGVWRTFPDLAQAANNVTEDRYGNIVIATWGGLCFCEGPTYRYLREQDGLGCNGVNRLIRDRAGNLWLGTLEGVSRYDGCNFLNFVPADGLAGTNIQSLYEDRRGRIWVGTRSGVSCIDMLVPRNISMEFEGPNCRVYCICEDSNRNMWFGTAEGVFTFDGTRFHDMAAAGFPRDYSRAVCQDASGTIWVAFDDKGLFAWKDNVLKEFKPDGEPVRLVASILEDGDNMWFGSWEKIRCCSGGETVCFDMEDGMCSTKIYQIFKDSTGRYWFAGSFKGLSCYDPLPLTFASRQHMSECMEKGREERFWWDNEDKLVRYDGNTVIQVASFDSAIDTIFEDGKQRVWVCTVGPRLYRCDAPTADGQLVFKDITSLLEGVTKSRVEVITEDRDGDVWIGYWSGMARFNSKGFEPVYWIDEAGNRISYSVFDLEQDRNGTFWLAGYHDDGLLSYDGKIFRRYTKKDGLVHNRVHRLKIDSRGRVWIGTIQGISCFDGLRFDNYSIDNNMELPFINDMIEDRMGRMWFATSGAGVSRFDGCEFQFLGQADGLPSNHVVGVQEAADGSFLIATQAGVCRYIPDYTSRPTVFIESVDADGKHDCLSDITVTANVPWVEISYGGTCPRTNRMRFRYTLEGYEDRWVSTWKSKARYERLPVGEYIFKVIAINRDLVASGSVAELKLIVVPDPRDRKIGELEANQKRVEHLRQIDHMRLRIARDLHDEVGANLGAISLLAQMVEPVCTVKTDVREIRQTAIRTIDALREIVWMIDPQHDRLDDLVARMKDVAEIMLSGVTYEFQFVNIALNVEVPLELRRNIMPVFKEILHNVRKHSGAVSVDIHGSFEAGVMGVCVADNGCGCDPNILSGGNGMKNMKRRMEEMHGSVKVESRRGEGTAISFYVPLS